MSKVSPVTFHLGLKAYYTTLIELWEVYLLITQFDRDLSLILKHHVPNAKSVVILENYFVESLGKYFRIYDTCG